MQSSAIPLVTSKGFFFAWHFSDGSGRNLCRQDWLKSHKGGTEDGFKSYWLSLPEEEINVCTISCFMVSHRFMSTLAVEKSGHHTGTSSLCSTYQNKLTDTAPPLEEGPQRRQEEEKSLVMLSFNSITLLTRFLQPNTLRDSGPIFTL